MSLSSTDRHPVELDAEKSTEHNLRYILWLICISALGGLLLGWDTSVISGAIGPIRDYFQLSAAEMGWAASCVVVGCIIGSFMVGPVSYHWGRRGALFTCCIVFFISAVGSALATNFTVYIIFRIIGGWAVGAACIICPMYMSEISPRAYRGRAVSCFQQSVIIGQTVIFYINFLIARGMTDAWLSDLGWRYMLGSEIIPAILFGIMLFTIPESPRYLVMKGKIDKAIQVFTKMSNRNHAEKLVKSVQDSLLEVENSSKNRVSLLAPGIFPLVLLGSFIIVSQQFSGIDVIMYYAPEILKPISGTEGALFQTTFIGITFIIGNIICMFLIDRIGRIPLMVWGTIGCAVGMGIVGFSFYSQNPGYGALAGIIIYALAYSISWGCVSWTLLSEIFPNSIRDRAMSIAGGCKFVAGFLITMFFPILNENEYLVEKFHGAFTFWMFAILALLAVIVVKVFVPETKGVALEEMQEHMVHKMKRFRLK